jgi:PAS fold
MELRWRQAIDAGDLAVWDLWHELETVHCSPQWKLLLGFPDPYNADSTHFWRCRVHPDDLEGMLAAMRAHLSGSQPSYEATFRLRSNGSGYRHVHSRGRVIERGAEGQALRMVGTMIDSTLRPLTPKGGLPDGPLGLLKDFPQAQPFHRLLGIERSAGDLLDSKRAQIALERDRILSMVKDLLHASVAQLDGLRTSHRHSHSVPPSQG